MEELNKFIEDIKEDWTIPKSIDEISEDLLFRCQFFHGFKKIDGFLKDLPQSFVDFYALANGAFLFEDVVYGQWGLQLLDVFLILQETNYFMQENKDYAQGDLIIAKFLGDSDFLLLRTDPTKNDYGSMMIVMPLESRNNWNKIELNFYDFIKEYVNNFGQKFWE
ncbi:SMI1/KNR4 family protein [Acinetobacter sp. VNK23]|uniref:SMI1/KNR4 family protein n=1 Tax=Acinetobacter thutiue TaxID=2998078 RepID=UPI002578C463|nr:SMI1/KNR4 family protein [Acinetobacter thutiue]MDM1020966.1 SMI1/KNR4 family protein [Acinetobacter thutiue]